MATKTRRDQRRDFFDRFQQGIETSVKLRETDYKKQEILRKTQHDLQKLQMDQVKTKLSMMKDYGGENPFEFKNANFNPFTGQQQPGRQNPRTGTYIPRNAGTPQQMQDAFPQSAIRKGPNGQVGLQIGDQIYPASITIGRNGKISGARLHTPSGELLGTSIKDLASQIAASRNGEAVVPDQAPALPSAQNIVGRQDTSVGFDTESAEELPPQNTEDIYKDKALKLTTLLQRNPNISQEDMFNIIDQSEDIPNGTKARLRALIRTIKRG